MNTVETTTWVGSFPLGLFAAAFFGAILAVCIFFRRAFDNAAHVGTPRSTAGVFIQAFTTWAIGLIVGFYGAPVIAEYFGVGDGPRFKALALATAALGVPLALGLTHVGEKLIGKWVASKE